MITWPRTISDRLYDPRERPYCPVKFLLGYGGARLLDILNRETHVTILMKAMHFPYVFYLWDKYKDLNEVKASRTVYHPHTPETAENEGTPGGYTGGDELLRRHQP